MNGHFLYCIPFAAGINLFFGTDVQAEHLRLKKELPNLKDDVQPFVGSWNDDDRHIEMCDFMNKNGLCTEMEYIVTKSSGGFDWREIKADGMVYHVQDDDHPAVPPGEWTRCELYFEIKGSTPSKDPWNGAQPGQSWQSVEEYIQHTTAKTQEGLKSTGQLALYAAAQLTSSSRNFIFSVFICGKTARFIRWDRSSAIVSEAIDFTEDPHTLALFLRAYSEAADNRRGWDHTVQPGQADDRELALQVLTSVGQSLGYIAQPDACPESGLELQPASKSQPFSENAALRRSQDGASHSTFATRNSDARKVSATDLPGNDSAGQGSVGKPGTHAVASSLASTSISGPLQDSATPTNAGTNVNTPITRPSHSRTVFEKILQIFKDETKPLHRVQVPLEDDTFVTCIVPGEALHKIRAVIGRGTRGYAAVCIEKMAVGWLKDTWRIATDSISAEGKTYAVLENAHMSNLPLIIACGDLIGQKTLVEELAHQPWVNKAVHKSLVPHQHYRLFIDLLGDSLHTFTSSKVMVQGVRDALKMWQFAYETCGVLHRDISPWNILLVADGGCLVDWELCSTYKDGKPIRGPRRGGRTGTWQFMSAALLQNPVNYVQSAEDDLESFVWVLLWICLRYLPNSLSHNASELQEVMTDLFDHSMNSGSSSGGYSKVQYFSGNGPLGRTFTVQNNRPLTKLLSKLQKLFDSRYAPQEYPPSDDEDYPPGCVPSTAAPVSTRQPVKAGSMIAAFERALLSDGWPSNDVAKDQIPAKLIDPSIYKTVPVSGNKSHSVNPTCADSGIATRSSRSRTTSVRDDASGSRPSAKRQRGHEDVASGERKAKKYKVTT